MLEKIADRITCRQVLNMMVMLGSMFNYMLRVNLSLAIVEMVYDTNTEIDQNSISSVNTNDSVLNIINTTTTSLNITFTEQPSGPKFHWAKYDQNYVLGSFFWGYLSTQIVGGRLAEIIGGRRVFGGTVLAASILTLLTPPACHLGCMVVVGLRVCVGFVFGPMYPAIPPMAAKWIPPLERSQFMSHMLASSLGSALTMPLCGFLIKTWGWESVFYVTGTIGLIWSVAWFFLIYDSPMEHPRINPEEKSYIQMTIAEATGNSTKPNKVPWMTILTSMPVWTIVFTNGFLLFGYLTVATQLPTYLKEVLHFSINNNGLLSSLPYLGNYFMAVTASYCADRLQRSGKYSTTLIRKGFTALAAFIPGLLMMVQAIFGSDPLLSVMLFTGSMLLNGAMTAGHLTNPLDIAPNFSGSIMGIANTFAAIGGSLSAIIVASITNKNHSFEQWRYVFWILAVIYILGGLIFVVLGTATLQQWNSTKMKSNSGSEMDQKMLPLKNEKMKLKCDEFPRPKEVFIN